MMNLLFYCTKSKEKLQEISQTWHANQFSTITLKIAFESIRQSSIILETAFLEAVFVLNCLMILIAAFRNIFRCS